MPAAEKLGVREMTVQPGQLSFEKFAATGPPFAHRLEFRYVSCVKSSDNAVARGAGGAALAGDATPTPATKMEAKRTNNTHKVPARRSPNRRTISLREMTEFNVLPPSLPRWRPGLLSFAREDPSCGTGCDFENRDVRPKCARTLQPGFGNTKPPKRNSSTDPGRWGSRELLFENSRKTLAYRTEARARNAGIFNPASGRVGHAPLHGHSPEGEGCHR